jgi:hypothetical protein
MGGKPDRKAADPGLRSRKQFYQFTEAKGAQYRCAPMPQTRNQVVCDWLDGIL